MLHSAETLIGYALDAEDSTLGSVHDFYIDDREWCVRYLVAKTIAYIGRKVLLSPARFRMEHFGACHAGGIGMAPGYS